jgi:hypothetical protein
MCRRACPRLRGHRTRAGNLIVVESARRSGTELGFVEYL